jgi:hypothetical protein
MFKLRTFVRAMVMIPLSPLFVIFLIGFLFFMLGTKFFLKLDTFIKYDASSRRRERIVMNIKQYTY